MVPETCTTSPETGTPPKKQKTYKTSKKQILTSEKWSRKGLAVEKKSRSMSRIHGCLEDGMAESFLSALANRGGRDSPLANRGGRDSPLANRGGRDSPLANRGGREGDVRDCSCSSHTGRVRTWRGTDFRSESESASV